MCSGAHLHSLTRPTKEGRGLFAGDPLLPLLLTVSHLPLIISDSESHVPACPLTISTSSLLVSSPIPFILLIHTPASALNQQASLPSSLPASLHTVTSATCTHLKLRRLRGDLGTEHTWALAGRAGHFIRTQPLLTTPTRGSHPPPKSFPACLHPNLSPF